MASSDARASSDSIFRRDVLQTVSVFWQSSVNSFSVPMILSSSFPAMSIETVKVNNVSLGVSERDIKEFFSFFGDIEYLKMQR
uniref:RRM domain-containing protein n=1 Tax=Cucumis melo TaxID=3656 RepID=A0A9I9EFD2_CUCME